jgi:IclR family transcriptional regulator, blcABC operon repressor
VGVTRGAARGGSPAVGRAVAILRALAAEPRSLSISELARATGLPKSSTSDVCGQLALDGLVTRDADARVTLGPCVARLARGLVRGTPLVELFMRGDLTPAALRGEATVLSVLHGGDVACLCSREGRMPLPVTFKAGMRLPAWQTASGRVLLARERTWTAGAIERRLRRAVQPSDPPPRWDRLAAELAGVAARGCAVDEETAAGMTAVAVAVDDPAGERPLAAIEVPSIAAPGDRGRGSELVAAARAFARALTDRLADG